MEKRLFVAVLISIAFLWIWGAVIPRIFPQLAKPKPVARAAEAKQPRPVAPPATPPVKNNTISTSPHPEPAEPVAVIREEKSIDTVIETANFIARFSNRGAQLVSFQLKDYHNKSSRLVDLVRSRESSRDDFPFAVLTADRRFTEEVNRSLYRVTEQSSKGRRTVEFRLGTSDGAMIEKKFVFTDAYLFEFSVTISGREIPFRVVVGPGINNLEDIMDREDRLLASGNLVIQREGSFDLIARDKASSFEIYDGQVDYVGLADSYFLTVLKRTQGGAATSRRMEMQLGEKTRKELYVGVNGSGGGVAGQAFFGPKKAELLDRHGLEENLQYGVFGFIARFLLLALIWLFQITKNYGWAIVVLTVLIKIVLYPLQHKSIVSMKKMQKLQPKVNALKEKYKKAKTDPEQRQKMNTEMMKLYQVEGINPMGGCLPILLQLPILWAFYTVLSNSIELRGADFMLWIHDLSDKDPYYITPILMTATMFIQQWITPTTIDPIQRRMFLMMPLVFGWIFKEFPSGLVLYWLVQNILSIIQQMIMNRYWKDHPEEIQLKKSAGAK